jgi:hypothetical protein
MDDSEIKFGLDIAIRVLSKRLSDAEVYEFPKRNQKTVAILRKEMQITLNSLKHVRNNDTLRREIANDMLVELLTK